jgi:hypothetical protein
VEEAQLGMKAMTPADFGTPISEWDVFFSAMVRFIEGYDIVICPVVAFPAQHCGFIMEKDKDLSFSYCFTYNLTGWPAAVVRG